MGVRINQRCDSCGKVRRLSDISHRDDGWKEVRPNKDLCGSCISEMLKPKEEAKSDAE